MSITLPTPSAALVEIRQGGKLIYTGIGTKVLLDLLRELIKAQSVGADLTSINEAIALLNTTVAASITGQNGIDVFGTLGSGGIVISGSSDNGILASQVFGG